MYAREYLRTFIISLFSEASSVRAYARVEHERRNSYRGEIRQRKFVNIALNGPISAVRLKSIASTLASRRMGYKRFDSVSGRSISARRRWSLDAH